MKRICSITLLAFLFLASNSFALNFHNLEVVSENREIEGWYFSSNIVIDPPSSSYDASVSFEFDTGTYTKPLTYVEFFSLAVYDTGQLDGDPLLYGGKPVTWRVNNGSETISATGMVPIICPIDQPCFNPIRQVELSTDFEVSGDPLHPTISWKNPDNQIEYYKVRLLDSSNHFLWQSPNLPYSDPNYGENPTYTIPAYDPANPAIGYDLQPGVAYIFRIEAREHWWFPVTGTGIDFLPIFGSLDHYADLMNRSTSFFPYTAPGPEPEPVLVDLHPDVFEVKWVQKKKAHCPGWNYISAYIALPEGLSESEIDTVTLSLGTTAIATEVSRHVIGNVLHVRFPLKTSVVSEILGLPVKEFYVYGETVKVKAFKRPTTPIELLELTISDGSTFAGRAVVRIVRDKH